MTDYDRKNKVCYWKRCSGCKACRDFVSNNDFALKYKEESFEENNDYSRKSVVKEKTCGCSPWCENSFKKEGSYNANLDSLTDSQAKNCV
jgi:hypothetical protein